MCSSPNVIYRMQTQMEERLRQLAHEFQRATNIRIADVMHNAVKRNIALNHELNSMLKVCQNLEMETTESKDNDGMLRLQCELYETEAKIALDDAKRKKQVMHKLAQDHIDMYLKFGQMQRENTTFRNHEQQMKEYVARGVVAQEKIKILERQLAETKKAKEDVMVEVRIKYKELNKLNNILDEAKQSILEALQVSMYIWLFLHT